MKKNLRNFKLFSAFAIIIFFLVTIMTYAEVIEDWKNSPGSDKYPDAKALILSDHIEYILNADGSVTWIEHEVIKILNNEGLQKFQKILRSYEKPNQSIDIEIARIIKPDGTVKNLEKDKEILTEAGFAEKVPLLKDIMIVTLEYSSVEIDDIIEFKLVYTDKKPIIKDYFWGISFTDDENPLEKTTFCVKMFKDADKLRWFTVGLENGKMKPEIKKIPKGTEYSWTLKNRAALVTEPAGPPLRDRATCIMVSTCPSWKEFSSAYYRALEPYIKLDATIKSEVKKIIQNVKEPDEKIFEIAKFVNNKKTIDMSFDADRMILFNLKDSLENETITKLNSGLLFIAMLRAAGFEAYPTLIADQKFGIVYKEIASPFQFNHLIAAVKVRNHWRYIDASSPFSRSMNLYSGMEGRDILPLKPTGAELELTAISSAENNLEEMISEAQLSPDGSMGVKIKIMETGAKKVYWESFLGMVKTQESQAFIFNKLVTLISENAKLIGYSKDEDPKYDSLTMEMTFMVEDYPTVSGNYWIIKMPLIPIQPPNFVSQDPSTRKYPVLLPNTSREVKTCTVVIPEGFTVKSIPKNVNISNRVGSLKINSRQEGDKIIYNYQLQVEKITIPVSEYRELQELFQKAYGASAEVILLEKADSPSSPTGSVLKKYPKGKTS